MTLMEELTGMRAEDFQTLPQSKRQELIEYNDEHVRQWRAVCQLCGEHLSGTRAQIREHRCREHSQ